MHPIERLRHVARAGSGVEPVVLVAEAAAALAGFSDDPAGLVAAARRLVARHPAVGPMWWAASRVVAAPDPARAARQAVEELEGDATPAVLARALPDEARVLVVGWPDAVVAALSRRGDLDVLAVDDGTGVDLARVLGRVDVAVRDVPTEGLGSAAAAADVVLLEARSVGPPGSVGALAAPGSRAAAAVARAAGRSVWLVAPVGTVVPEAVLAVAVEGAVDAEEPWESELDVVFLDLVDRVVGPDGPGDPADLARRAGAVAAELLSGGSTPGTH